MDSHWKAWTPATTPLKARRVGRRLVAMLEADESSLQIEPYPKTHGHVLMFTAQFEQPTWAEAVIAVLRRARGAGYGWSIGGPIDHELHLHTNHISSVGITMLTCRLKRGG